MSEGYLSTRSNFGYSNGHTGVLQSSEICTRDSYTLKGSVDKIQSNGLLLQGEKRGNSRPPAQERERVAAEKRNLSDEKFKTFLLE